MTSPLAILVGTGFCGALTTYSTFSYETVRLAQERAYFYAVANVLASVFAGLGAVLIGYTVTRSLVEPAVRYVSGTCSGSWWA